ncbi:MAG: glycosyltransferase [bacterium]|jgi:hypothetical protein
MSVTTLLTGDDMITAVVPACNEAARIQKVLASIFAAGVDRTLVIVNGDELTSQKSLALSLPGITTVNFPERLGIDVPRVIGAWLAAAAGTRVCLFVDGDMTGDITFCLSDLIRQVKQGADMALTDCYPNPPCVQGLAREVLSYRAKLNRKLGLFPTLGVATPSHGPHAVSGQLLAALPLPELAVPPVSLALAVEGGLRVSIGARIDHNNLGSPLKDYPHSRKIADTIIGDSLEAISLAAGKPRRRTAAGRLYLGYHPERRFDIMDAVLANSLPRRYSLSGAPLPLEK